MTIIMRSVGTILRRSEKYLKTDMVYAARGGFWLTVSHVGGMAAGLAVSIVMANLISSQALGTYKFVISLVGIFGAFTLTGMGTAITQAVARGYEGVLRHGFEAQLKWSMGVVILSFASSIYYALNGNATLSISLFVAGALSPFIASFSLFNSYIAGKKDFKNQTILSLFNGIAPSIAVITTVTLTDNAGAILATYFLSHAVTSTICYTYTIKKYRPKTKTDESTVSFGKHLSAMDILTNLALNIDKVLVFHYLGATELAVYSLAITPVDQLRNTNKILNRLAFPKFSQKNFREIQRTLLPKVLFISLIMAMISLLYFLSAPTLFRFFFPNYLASVPFSQAYVLVLILLPTTLYGQALTAHMKKRELYIAKTATPIVSIGLLLVFLPIYGIWGAIWALLLARLFNAIIAMYLFYMCK